MKVFFWKKLFCTRKKLIFIFFFVLLIFIQLKCVQYIKLINQIYNDGVRVNEIYIKLLKNLNENGIEDDSGRFKFTYFESDGKEKNDLTLVTQCTVNHLHYLKNLLYHWKGPISVAVFIDAEHILQGFWDISLLLFCIDDTDLFRLHVVIPKFIFTYNKHPGFTDIIDCQSISFSYPKNPANYNWTTPYPVNLMRNIAKRSANTEFILVIDIDMIPSFDLQYSFLSFSKALQNPNLTEVFVVPAFEIPHYAILPTSKSQLQISYDLKVARQFYYEPCFACHELTGYEVWFARISETVTIVHEVLWKYPWEPFFIARKNVPDFDERFEQYGMNRVSQICELHMAGYKFYVLSNVFLVHQGYKSWKDFHSSKETDMKNNRKTYSVFRAEMKYKYPKSDKHCQF